MRCTTWRSHSTPSPSQVSDDITGLGFVHTARRCMWRSGTACALLYPHQHRKAAAAQDHRFSRPCRTHTQARLDPKPLLQLAPELLCPLLRLCVQHIPHTLTNTSCCLFASTGDWNGAGGHVNYSNNATRAKGTGWDAIQAQIAKLEKRHAFHIAQYGEVSHFAVRLGEGTGGPEMGQLCFSGFRKGEPVLLAPERGGRGSWKKNCTSFQSAVCSVLIHRHRLASKRIAYLLCCTCMASDMLLLHP